MQNYILIITICIIVFFATFFIGFVLNFLYEFFTGQLFENDNDEDYLNH